MTVPIAILLACVAARGSGELFSSMAHLQSALYSERDIAKEIRHYIYSEQERLEKLSQLANEFEQHSTMALKDPDRYMGNPVNAYLFVKHFTLDWDRDIDVIIKNNSREELSNKIEEMRQLLPSYEDLTGSVNALLRLQDTYKLDTTELARGNVGGVSSSELTAWDCFELGRLAYNDEDYYHTIMWMEEALDKVREFEDEGDDVNIVSILDYLAFALYKQGNVQRALTLTNEMLSLSPDHSRALGNKQYYEKMLGEDTISGKRGDDGVVINQRQLDEYRSGEEYQNYEALCRGENVKEYKDQHKLFCRYRNNSPLLVLSPMKEEVLYLNPYIAVFYESITDPEIELIKSLAIPKLGRATVHNPKTGKLETAGYRVSKSCWLSENDSPRIGYINQRISAVTGLDMATAEELQIANYGIGGQYEPHFDFARKEEKAFQALGTGNRIATLMFYISDVQAGGATVFPYLGLKIFPEKGKSVFWYNLYKNGEGIYNTRHAACPVLVGSKWVSNKWIHERGQEFRRPCGLSEAE